MTKSFALSYYYRRVFFAFGLDCLIKSRVRITGHYVALQIKGIVFQNNFALPPSFPIVAVEKEVACLLDGFLTG